MGDAYDELLSMIRLSLGEKDLEYSEGSDLILDLSEIDDLETSSESMMVSGEGVFTTSLVLPDKSTEPVSPDPVPLTKSLGGKSNVILLPKKVKKTPRKRNTKHKRAKKKAKIYVEEDSSEDDGLVSEKFDIIGRCSDDAVFFERQSARFGKTIRSFLSSTKLRSFQVKTLLTDIPNNYFEVRILKANNGLTAVGIALDDFPLKTFLPGKNELSYSFNTNSELLIGPHYNFPHNIPVNAEFKGRTIVGCGICMNQIYWTVDGKMVLRVLLKQNVKGAFYPTITVNSSNTIQVIVNPDLQKFSPTSEKLEVKFSKKIVTYFPEPTDTLLNLNSKNKKKYFGKLCKYFSRDKWIEISALYHPDSNSVLFEAIKTMKHDVVIDLLDSWSEVSLHKVLNINAKDDLGDFPLYYAAKNGFEDIVRSLLRCNANTKLATVNGTPLHVACREGHTTIMDLLLTKRFDVNSQDHKSLFTPLHIAALEGRNEVCKYLLNEDANPNLLNSSLETALHLSVLHGFDECVKTLLESSIIIDGLDNQGNTALHIAVANNHIEICRLLCEKRANVNIPNNRGQTTIHIATRESRVECLEFLILNNPLLELKETEHQYTPMHLAAITGNRKIGKILVDAGAEIDSISLTGEFPLLLSAKNKNIEFSEFLVSCGADETVLLDNLSDNENDENLVSFVVDIRNKRDMSLNDISIASWQTKESFITQLTRMPDVDFVRTFFISYPLVFTADELLTELIASYFGNPPENQSEEYIEIWKKRTQRPVKIRVLSCLSHWVSMRRTEDFTDELFHRLLHFLVDVSTDQTDLLWRQALNLQREILPMLYDRPTEQSSYRTRQIKQRTKTARINRNNTLEKSPSGNLKNPKDITQFKIEDVAQTLTVLAHEKFKKVTPRELFNKICVKNSHTPNLDDYIDFMNNTSFFFIQEILMHLEDEPRIQVITFICRVAMLCFDYFNIETFFQIVVGLNSFSISRLTLSWMQVAQKYAIVKEADLLSENYGLIRGVMEKAQAPTVPFAGLLLRDLVYIHDGNVTKNTEEEIIRYNYTKMNLLGTQIQRFVAYQAVDYPFEKDTEIVDYFESRIKEFEGKLLDDMEDGYWKRSKEIQEKKFEIPLDFKNTLKRNSQIF